MEQLLLHLLGDYITQSHWTAINKVKSWFPAAIHATVYSLPFLAIGSLYAVAVILSTHFLIDRYRLARYVVFAKNKLGGSPKLQWAECSATGMPADVPPWLAVWLLIIADNAMHLIINYLSLKYL